MKRSLGILTLATVLATSLGTFSTAAAADVGAGKVSFVTGSNFDRVVVVRADGSGRRTFSVGGLATMAWSPAGDRIALIRQTQIEGVVTSSSIYITDAQGRHRRRITPVPGGIVGACTSAVECASQPQGAFAWSPGGKRIAFTGGGRLFVVNSDGTRLRRLTDPTVGMDLEPSWSPDGKRIAFYRYVDGVLAVSGSIHVIDANGAHDKAVSRSGQVAANARWAPDGRSIAYLVQPNQAPTPVVLQRAPAQLWVMRPDGSRARRVFGGAESGAPPQWSPDSRWIATEGGRLAGTAIVLYKVTSPGRRILAAREQTFTVAPVWSLGGSRLAYLAFNDFGIWTQDTSGHHRRRLALADQSMGQLAWSR